MSLTCRSFVAVALARRVPGADVAAAAAVIVARPDMSIVPGPWEVPVWPVACLPACAGLWPVQTPAVEEISAHVDHSRSQDALLPS